ncbi:MAG: PEP-CTERM sorting domain-containing protein [Pseudomonadota bacterium]
MNLYLSRLAAAFIFLLVSANSQAGLLYNLSWSSSGASQGLAFDGPGTTDYQATGLIELRPDIAVGSAFGTSDVLSLSLSIFVDGIFDVSRVFPNSGTNFFRGTRLVSSLSISDFFVGEITGSTFGFGCRGSDCSGGGVDIPRGSGVLDQVTFANQAVAQASFVATAITAVPESTTLALMGLGLVSVGYRKRRSKAPYEQ